MDGKHATEIRSSLNMKSEVGIGLRRVIGHEELC